MSEQLFIARFLNIHRSGVLTALAWLVPHEMLPSRRVLYTPYNHASCHFTQSHIHKVYACLAVTCHLHFWQNDRDFLRVTVVTRGWNGYRSKSQHRKLTLEKKILPPLQTGALTTELSPPPTIYIYNWTKEVKGKGETKERWPIVICFDVM